MTWRQKLLHTNLYDLLCRMQENIEQANCDDVVKPCIMNALGVSETAALRRCDMYGIHCDDCIAAWMNERSK